LRKCSVKNHIKYSICFSICVGLFGMGVLVSEVLFLSLFPAPLGSIKISTYNQMIFLLVATLVAWFSAVVWYLNGDEK